MRDNLSVVCGPVPVSAEEIETDLAVLRSIFAKHKRVLNIQESVDGGHFVTTSCSRVLETEILDKLLGRATLSLGPGKLTVFLRDHHSFRTTLLEQKLVKRVQELEVENAQLRDVIECAWSSGRGDPRG